jgi:hypothetical protein
MANFIHDVPGRLRIRIPAVKRLPELGPEVQGAFLGLDGIEYIRVNPVTGSVVFRYDPAAIDSTRIFNRLTAHGFIESGSQSLPTRSPRRSPSRPGQVVGKALFGWAVEKALEPTGLSFLAALI